MISKQELISQTLSVLDENALNKQINNERIGCLFDFPDENGKPYKSSGGRMFYQGKLSRVGIVHVGKLLAKDWQ